MKEGYHPGVEKNFLKQKYEAVLWKKADELSEARVNLSDTVGKLFNEVKKIRDSKGDMDVIREKQAEYWTLVKEVEAIKETEEELQEVLLQLENGIINEDALKEFMPDEKGEVKKLSKKKQRILEERVRLEALKDKFVFEYGQEGRKTPETRHIGSGRRATGIKGNFEAASAEKIFIERSSDTHGGKTRDFGKKAGSYTDKNGKRIRKR